MSRVFLVEFKDDVKRTRWVFSRSGGTQSSSGDETGKAGFGCAWAGQGGGPPEHGAFPNNWENGLELAPPLSTQTQALRGDHIA